MYNHTVTLWEMAQGFQKHFWCSSREGRRATSPQLAHGWLAGRQRLAHGTWVPASGADWLAPLSNGNEGWLLCGREESAALQRQLRLPRCPPWLPQKRPAWCRSRGVHKLWWYSKAVAVMYHPQDRKKYPTYCISSLVASWWKFERHGPTGDS